MSHYRKGEVVGTAFGFYSPDQVRRLSVKQVYNPTSFNLLNQAEVGGLYDPSLGPIEFGAQCQTCGLNSKDCPGHFGHIELPLPVYNPLVFKVLLKLMRAKCFNCHRFRMHPSLVALFVEKMVALENGDLVLARQLEEKEINMKFERRTTKAEDDDDEDEEMSDGENKADDDNKHSSTKGQREFNYESERSHRTHIVSERKRTCVQFLRRVLALKKCDSCCAYSPAVRADGEVKLFQVPLSKKYQQQMDDLGLKTSLYGPAKEEEVDSSKPGPKKQRYISPKEAKEHLSLLWRKEIVILRHLFSSPPATWLRPGVRPAGSDAATTAMLRTSSPDVLFLDVLAVPPSRFRPSNLINGMISEHAQTASYVKVLNLSARLVEIGRSDGKEVETIYRRNTSAAANLVSIWIELQQTVNYLVDNSRAPPVHNVPPGIKQLLEKKEGLFRMHVMGKRVNYSARTVISPDPHIATNEIGIPRYFATRLTYPQCVTAFNVDEARQAVLNGPDVHPGANMVQNEDGRIVHLKADDRDSREAIAKTLLTQSASNPHAIKKVFRHIRDGDAVLTNRQPTLHKPSIMSHKVRVLSNEKTLRLHYANCKTFNADFDGDEMNIHFPQDELARSEAYNLAFSDHQYIVPTDGSPIRGLIQDHVVMGCHLCKRDTFITRARFQQILYASLCNISGAAKSFRMPPPAILLPTPLWTGKQAITALLNHLTGDKHAPITFTSKCKVPGDMWGKAGTEDGVVNVRQNHLVHGVIDKNQYGAFGLVHGCYELYGSEFAGMLLTALGRLFNAVIQHVGFTCGIDDMMIERGAERRRSEFLNESHVIGRKVARTFIGQELGKEGAAQVGNDPNAISISMEKILQSGGDAASGTLDGMMKVDTHRITSKVISTCIPGGQVKPFPANNLSLMTVSGAKGSVVNFSQISCLLGQQELEGKRVPRMVSGKTLPCFEPFDSAARAGGFISDRFLTGIRPQEYFFHCMAGREGLVDTAVKTSRSGYLQRCLVKHLEGLSVNYDMTVRDADGAVVQFRYGEDAVNPMSSKFLSRFGFYVENYEAMLQKCKPERVASHLDMNTAPRALKKKKRAERNAAKQAAPKDASEALEARIAMPDPVMSDLNPGRCLGATSEKFNADLEEYIRTNPDGLLMDSSSSKRKGKKRRQSKGDADDSLTSDGRKKMDATQFRLLMYLNYINSLANPGEAVGVVAAQSIGEPSTQMTLNTFHLAGRGDLNVTLGVPRLRELIMVASSNIQTPSMSLPVPSGEAAADMLAAKLQRVPFSDLLRSVTCRDQVIPGSQANNGMRSRSYTIHMQFCPSDQLKSRHDLDFKGVSKFAEKRFLRMLCTAILKELKIRTTADNMDDVGKGTTAAEYGGREEEAADESAMPTKQAKASAAAAAASSMDARRKQRKQEISYGNDDEAAANDDDDDDNDDDDAAPAAAAAAAAGGGDEVKVETKPTKAQTTSSTSSLKAQAEWKDALLAQYEILNDYSFNEKAQSLTVVVHVPIGRKILMVSLVEAVAVKCAIEPVAKISRCFVNEEKTSATDRRYVVATEGVNLRGVWEHRDVIDVHSMMCNDVMGILQTYGVEAARAAVSQQISAVFGVYGIAVNSRHLSLLADYMTFEGKLRACNRTGMESNISPLQQMSFETTMTFLTQSALAGDYDGCESPSARITLGTLVGLGTGSFDVRQPLV